MRLGAEPVGRWGLTLMAVTGVAGLLLAWHGWTGRASAVAPSLAGGSAGGGPSAAGPSSSRAPAGRATTASPAASSAPPSGGSSSSRVGPKLSSEPFASAAFQIWPGTMSLTARQALTGLNVSVHKQAAGLSVTAGVNGQAPAAPHLYTGGVRVYVVEASMGDDSGNSDYSLGDDGLVVTDAQGRIIQ